VGFLVSGFGLQNGRQGIGLSLSLLLLASASLTACGQKDTNGPSAMEQKIEAMMDKMGVPGASATPSRPAMALDCPPIKSMLDEVRSAPQSISPASRRALNAWARWCNLETVPEQAS
jgi:hypothetical protein